MGCALLVWVGFYDSFSIYCESTVEGHFIPNGRRSETERRRIQDGIGRGRLIFDREPRPFFLEKRTLFRRSAFRLALFPRTADFSRHPTVGKFNLQKPFGF